MKKKLIYLFLMIVLCIGSLGYGMLIYRNNFFPHSHIEKEYSALTSLISPWAVGIYEGPTPFQLKDPEKISNPVLTREDITDIDALFIADPFIAIKNKKYSMFFEVFNRTTHQGDIGLAESLNGIDWEYKKIIIDEPFHLSYPYVFQWENNYYLIPESGEDLSVRLYKATSFPDKWEYIGNLLSGYKYIDPSIFRYKDKWWLLVSSDTGVLNLYYSDDLLKGWRHHPKNPIVKFNKSIARSAGRVFTYKERLYRLAQDGIPRYGSRVFAFEITELTEESYEERFASEKPIVTFTGKGWNAGRMHHVDLHEIDGKWIGAVDGRVK